MESLTEMDIDNLVRMANRIADFFQTMPDHTEAVQGVAEHLRKFWEPRMRRALLSHIEAAGTGGDGGGVHPLVREAVSAYRTELA